jgi:uncharacterized membrane protein YccC
MTLLSLRAKESIRTGLAVVIVYAIAFHLGWDKPYWGAFAAIMISLDTAGQSLNKAALRMLGTLVGGLVALILISLFPQERWSMLLWLSAYYGFCTYMMTGSERPYFWLVSAFVCIIIMADAMPADSLRAFQTVVTRVEETGMGILVYSLIAVLLWPRSSRSDLDAASRNLLASQSQLYRTYRDLMAGHGTAEDSRPLRLQEVHLSSELGQALGAAKLDSYEVFEVRRQWQQFQAVSIALMEALERWRESFPEVQQLDLTKLLPNLEAVGAELDERFAQIERMLRDEASTTTPNPISLTIDRTELNSFTHFQRAAVAVTKTQLDRLETLTSSLFDCVRDIRGFGSPSRGSQPTRDRSRGPDLDPDRLAATARVMAALWIAFLVWIYVDPPSHALFVFLTAHWTMATVMAHASPTRLLPGFVLSIVLGGVVYVLVMPHLSGFGELGLMLFGVHFAVFYLFWEPAHRMTRSVTLAMFNVLIAIDNQQTYDFAHYANTSASLLLALALAVAISYFPTSPRPEKVFLRLLRRFFRHAEFLISRLALDRDEKKGIATRWRMALYRNGLMELPAKLGALAPKIDYRLLPDSTSEQVQTLATNLQAVAYRIKELVEARESPQADLLVRELHDDLRAWRVVVQTQLQLWADDPAQGIARGGEMQERLAARLAQLEARIEAFRATDEGALSARDYENFYRYLGALRGLSESAIDYFRLAQEIDWAQWREARF